MALWPGDPSTLSGLPTAPVLWAAPKIQSLNTAIHDALPDMKKAAAENPNAEVLVRAVKFSQRCQLARRHT